MKKVLWMAGVLFAGQAFAGSDDLPGLLEVVRVVTGQGSSAPSQPQASPSPTHSTGKSSTPASKKTQGSAVAHNGIEKAFAKLNKCGDSGIYEQRSPDYLKGLTPRLIGSSAIYTGKWDYHGLPVSSIQLVNTAQLKGDFVYGLAFDADLPTVQATLGKIFKSQWSTVARMSDGYGGTITRALSVQAGKTVLTCTVPPAGD